MRFIGRKFMGKDFGESTRFDRFRSTTESGALPEAPIVGKVRKIESSFLAKVLWHLLEMDAEMGKMMLGR